MAKRILHREEIGELVVEVQEVTKKNGELIRVQFIVGRPFEWNEKTLIDSGFTSENIKPMGICIRRGIELLKEKPWENVLEEEDIEVPTPIVEDDDIPF